mgnify:CR=1 FL=1
MLDLFKEFREHNKYRDDKFKRRCKTLEDIIRSHKCFTSQDVYKYAHVEDEIKRRKSRESCYLLINISMIAINFVVCVWLSIKRY